MSLISTAPPARAAEIFRLGPDNWSKAPGGKEVDAIYGDYLVRNDRVVAVIADTVPGRNANVSLQNVQGCVIDFTLREANNDQLTAFLAQGQRDAGFGNAPFTHVMEVRLELKDFQECGLALCRQQPDLPRRGWKRVRAQSRYARRAARRQERTARGSAEP